jgi:hypothetical protein
MTTKKDLLLAAFGITFLATSAPTTGSQILEQLLKSAKSDKARAEVKAMLEQSKTNFLASND